MLVNLSEILDIAEERGFAVPAFNVYNLETVLGVAQAAQQSHAPVIFQVYSRLFDGPNARYLSPLILEAIRSLPTPAAFHLDHGAGVPQVQRALRYGASGIMVDASTCPLEENIARTREVVALCHAVNVPVEGELGHIGTTRDEIPTEHTLVNEAEQYVNETGVSALAIMVGTAHGRYKQTPILNINRIAEIKASTRAHLVLHGGSGVSDNQLQSAIRAGIRKVNFGTDLCYAFLDSLAGVSRDVVAVDLFMKEPIESVKRFALGKIAQLGANRYD